MRKTIHSLPLKCSILICLILLLTTVFPQTSPGVWETNGPAISIGVNEVLVMPDDPNTIFVGTGALLTGRGVFRSTNGGRDWLQSRPPLDEDIIQTLDIYDGILYATRAVDPGSQNLFRSADGENWQLVELPFDSIPPFVEVVTGTSGIHYAGTNSDGIFRSDDLGQTWSAMPADPPITSLVFTIISMDGILYCGSGNGMYRSADGLTWNFIPGTEGFEATAFHVKDNVIYVARGSTSDNFNTGIIFSNDGLNWQPASPSMDDKRVSAIVAKGDTLFAAVSDAIAFTGLGVFWSMDGLNWVQTNPPLTDIFIDVLSSAHGRIFASITDSITFEKILFFSNNGLDWQLANGLPTDDLMGAVVAAGSRSFTSTHGGLFVSLDRGENWIQRNMQTRASTEGLFANESILIAYGDDGVQRSVDGGSEWQQASGLLKSTLIGGFAEIDGTFFIGTIFGNNVFRSFNGLDWTATNFPSGFRFISDMAASGNTLYAATTDGLYTSNDQENWQKVDLVGPVQGSFSTPAVFPLDGTIYAVSWNSAPSSTLFYKRVDAENWLPTDLGFSGNVSFSSMISEGNYVYAATTRREADLIPCFGVYRSSDGLSWTATNFPGAVVCTNALAADSSGRLYAGSEDHGVFYSDDGLNWTPAHPPINDKDVTALTVVDGVVYAGTRAHGVFRSINRGVDWTALSTGLDEFLAINDLLPFVFPDTKQLYVATSNGVFSQMLDLTEPVAQSISVPGDPNFTAEQDIILLVEVEGADSMVISTDSTFIATAWQMYQSPAAFSLPVDEEDGLKTIYAKFKDFSVNESGSINTQIYLDTKPPAFQPHTPPQNAVVGQNLQIFQQVDDVNLEEVRLVYRRAGDENPFISLFQNSSVTIDGSLITSRGLDYRIIASDSAGNDSTLRNGNLDYFSLPIDVNASRAGNSQALPGGTTGSAYSIVSLPMNANTPPPASTVFGDLGKYGADGEWRFWNYRGNNQWEEGENITLQHGSGYFLIVRESRSLSNGVGGTSTLVSDGVMGNIPGWSLTAGDWTLIGNPYNTRIELDQLKFANSGRLLSESNNIWIYDGSWKNAVVEERALEPWKGLMIFADSSDQIVFANADDPFVSGSGTGKRSAGWNLENLTESEWLVAVRVERDGFVDESNYLGVKQAATAGYDNLDWREPPVSPNGIAVSFGLPETETTIRLSADLRPPEQAGYRWELEVRGPPGEAVSLRFDEIAAMPHHFRMLLLDEASGLLRDLRIQQDTRVHIAKETGVKKLSVLIGDEIFVSQETAGLELIPGQFALYQNYPNPFNPATTIRYALPSPGKVTIKIYDILGRIVQTLAEKQPRQPGFYEAVADFRNQASGLYFYRIAVDGEQPFQDVKKMLLVK